jgi:pyruvate/2-oxoglutarate dehydrogenase complex dihydrolipoamide dehydrogenase (E3) component
VLTNEALFDLTERPARLTVVGAGAIGCEMAQAMARLGSEVTLVDLAERVLANDASDAGAIVQGALARDGVRLCLGAGVERFERDGDTRVTVLSSGERIEADAILLAVGRTPNLDLGLDAAGVRYSKGGVEVDDFLRTSNPRIYAAGDVIGQAQFTHAAYHHARLVIGNALFFLRGRASGLVIPHATYTEPELAAVGLTGEAAARDPSLTPYTAHLDDNDRGRTEGETEGFLRVWVDPKGRIRGATLVGQHAGELLAPVTVAMTHGIRLHDLATTVFPYPTRSELLFAVAGQHNKTRMAPWMKRALRWALGVLR